MHVARLLCLGVLLCVAMTAQAEPPRARTTAAVQQPAQQGPSAPLPVQPQPAPPPAAAQQDAQMAQNAAAIEENPDWAVTLERIASSVV
ncbi:MAG: hypothetical protein JOZ93_03620, partial [Sinobacteraceae bacterium]|nr:hypothetical protein [Nevskiaceae bacterium]